MGTNGWPEITANVSQTFSEDMGECLVYTRGASQLVISVGGDIFVEPGDSLSFYSWVLYGDYKQLHVFCRMNNGQRNEIQNKNMIFAGESPYHYPTLEAHRQYVHERLNPPPPPVPTFTDTRPPSYSDMLRDTVWGVVVTAVAIDDDVTEMAAAVTFDEVRFDNIPSFVDQIISKAGNQKVRRLHVYAHGHRDGLVLGSDKLTVANFVQHQPELTRLGNHLAPHGWLILHSCLIGNALTLLRYLSKLWNVHIIGGIGDQSLEHVVVTSNYAVGYDYNEIGYQVVKATGEEFTRTYFPPGFRHNGNDYLQQKTLGALF